MGMLLKDIKGISLEEAYEINETLGLSFIIKDGKIKGMKVEVK